MEPVASRRRSVPAGIGLLLLLPALVALLISYVGPTYSTIRLSFHDVSMGPAEKDVGGKNYEAISERLGHIFGFALSLGVLPLVTLLVVAPLLAYATHRAGRAVRWVVRIALALPMVVVGTSTLAAGRLLSLIDEQVSILKDAEAVPMEVRKAVWLTTFGLVCGVGVTIFLAVLRRREPGGKSSREDGRRIWPTTLVLAALGVITTVALALQSFGLPYVLTGGGPSGATTTPMVDMVQVGFSTLRLGPAAAKATILLIPLLLLGLIAGLLVILSGLRMEVDGSQPTDTSDRSHATAESSRSQPTEESHQRQSTDESSRWSSDRIIATIGVAVGLVVVLVASRSGLWPTLSRLNGADVPTSAVSVYIHTWLPPLISTIVGVGLAALAGFAVGALRPLGRYSEFLLLPFAPWLFVGTGPLLIANRLEVRNDERLDTFLGLIPPVWIVLPALFVFTVLFRGHELRRRELPASAATVATPRDGGVVRTTVSTGRMVLLMLLVGGMTWLVQAQDLLWQMLVATDVDHYTGPLLVAQQLMRFNVDEISLGWALPLPVLVLSGIALALVQVLCLDRLVIHMGRQ